MAAPHKIGKPLIGFVGIGKMGSQIVQRLLRVGYQVTAYDRTREKLHAVIEHGAQIADTPRELAKNCDTIISCVTDDEAVAAIMYGDDGVLAGVNEQKILIDMSTVSLEASRRLHAAAWAKGSRMIDAPVSGSAPVAREGQLVIFVGGEQEVYQQCQPVLEALGRAVYHVGPAGSGVIMKLVVNTVLGVGMQAIAEAVVLGQKAGLDKGKLLDVLDQTSVIAPAHKGKLENIQHDEYPEQFTPALMLKDLNLIMRLANELSITMPATFTTEQIYRVAVAWGFHHDYSEITQVMARLAEPFSAPTRGRNN